MHQDSLDEPLEDIEQEILREELAMTQAQRRFYSSQECVEAREALQNLVDDPEYTTDSGYFSTDERGFVGRHLSYLSHNQKTNLDGYISNLKIMTRTLRRK